jgi:hypothetical protein
MRFRDLMVGDRFQFTSGLWCHTCVKTGPRKYETVDPVPHYQANAMEILKPMKLSVGSINANVEKEPHNA